MRNRILKISITFICVMLFQLTIFSQNSDYNLIKKELTQKQVELLQKEKEVIKANREAFKASLTKEQLAILRDKTLSKAQIKKRLVATFSSAQRSMVQTQQIRLRKTRENFRKSLTNDQRKMLRERIDKIQNSKDRGELRDGTRVNRVDMKKRRN